MSKCRPLSAWSDERGRIFRPAGDAMSSTRSSAPDATRLAVALRDGLLRESLARSLGDFPDLAVVASFGSVDALEAWHAEGQVDVLVIDHLLLDCRLARLEPVDAALKMILLVPAEAPEITRYSLRLAACHVVGCDSNLADLVSAIRLAAEGGAPRIRDDRRGSALSDREIEVLQLLSVGLSSRAIGDQLKVSARTVESHRRRMMAKLGASSIAEVICAAIRRGLLH